jgi:protoporphyrinogen oxidase
MPIWITFKAGFTYWYAFFRYFFARRKGEDNFEDWVRNRFGGTLYNLFFHDYTKKTWGLDPKNISSVWASERIKTSNLFSMIKNSLIKPDPESKIAMTLYKQFFYPSRGIQVLSNSMAKSIKENNNQIHLEKTLTSIKVEQDKIIQLTFNEEEKVTDFDTVVSSIPIPTLITALGEHPPKEIQNAASRLKYRDLILIGFMLDKEEATSDSWIYFPEDQHIFVRVSEPSKYGGKMCPPRKTSIIAEITCNESDNKWKLSDQKLIQLVQEQLLDLSFLSQNEIIDSFCLRITHAYPIFDIDYKKNIKLILTYLSQFSNLELIGRTGTFQYLNMDLVLLHGLNCGKKIVGTSEDSSTQISHAQKWVG